MVRISSRVLIIAALTWLAFLLFYDTYQLWKLGPEDEGYDPTRIVVGFIGVVALGIVVGTVFAITLLPVLGDQIGHFFYTPNQLVEKDPHAEAVSLIAAGEYEDAVDAYKAIVHKEPSDVHAASEAARVLAERLERPDDAVQFLRECLGHEHTREQYAFLCERIILIELDHLNDINAALPLLRNLIREYEGTSHAANAMHKIREIESAYGVEHGTLSEDMATLDTGVIPDAATSEPDESDPDHNRGA